MQAFFIPAVTPHPPSHLYPHSPLNTTPLSPYLTPHITLTLPSLSLTLPRSPSVVRQTLTYSIKADEVALISISLPSPPPRTRRPARPRPAPAPCRAALGLAGRRGTRRVTGPSGGTVNLGINLMARTECSLISNLIGYSTQAPPRLTPPRLTPPHPAPPRTAPQLPDPPRHAPPRLWVFLLAVRVWWAGRGAGAVWAARGGQSAVVRVFVQRRQRGEAEVTGEQARTQTDRQAERLPEDINIRDSMTNMHRQSKRKG